MIASASFNDKGDWIAVSKNHASASDSGIEAWLKGAIDSAGFTVRRLKISGDAWFISDGRKTCKFDF